jgi:hypothetical protein
MCIKRITYVSLCLNVLLIAVGLVLFLRNRNSERALEGEGYAEASARLHQDMLNLQRLNEGGKGPEELIRELKGEQAMLFNMEVNAAARLVEGRSSSSESFIRLKQELNTAHEFMAVARVNQ